MTNEGIIERAKESVRKHYNCNGEYPCRDSGYCEMCGGHNTPYDCCECGAGDYLEGYIAGATEQKKIDDVKYKKLRELAYTMYTQAQYLSTDGRDLRKAMENFYHYINYEEDN